MCGIAGFSLTPESKVNARKLSHALLVGIEKRGNQASGYAWNTSTGSGFYKQDVAGSNLPLKAMPKQASSVILHTRLATHGSIKNNANNHPVQSPDNNISLVHNGVIYNHDIVRKQMPGFSLPEVDTAVIPALLQKFSTPDKFSMLDGDAAVAWLDESQRGTLKLARISHSPLTVAQLLDGSFVFASTESILTNALKSAGLAYTFIMDVKERTLLTIRQGRIDELSTVPNLDPAFETPMSAYDYKYYRGQTSGGKKSAKQWVEGYGYDDPQSGVWTEYDEGFDDYLANFVFHEGFYYDFDGTYIGPEENLREAYEQFRYNKYWSNKNMCYTVNPDEESIDDYSPASEDALEDTYGYQFNASQTIGSRYNRRSYWD